MAASVPKRIRAPYTSTMIEEAIIEDAPGGDITSESIIPERAKCSATLIAKESMTICGIDLFRSVFKVVDPRISTTLHVKDGAVVKKGTTLATLEGPARGVLLGERVALNFLARLSGIATLTRTYVNALGKSKTKILDTRKTAPLYRDLEKYAVTVGGGMNHRRDLSAMVLIKENHIAVAGGIAEAVYAVRKYRRRSFITVEAANMADVKAALEARVGRILLDNMTPTQVQKAVEVVAGAAETEASGNMTIDTVRQYAETGVDFISVGAITHSAPSTDLSLIVAFAQKP
jgi:nicotinate-nucleotide pyrophosphorylase (carboxylating)